MLSADSAIEHNSHWKKVIEEALNLEQFQHSDLTDL